MSKQVFFSPLAVADLFSEAWKHGCVSLHHRLALQNILLDLSLTQDDREAIDRLLHAVRRGWLKILD